MIEVSDSKNQKQPEQLKKFNFFEIEKVTQKIDDPSSHPIKLNDIAVAEIAMIGPRILLLDRATNRILVYVKNIEGYWTPYSGCTLRMTTNDTSEDGLLLTYGQDAQSQALTSYIKIWKLGYIRQGYESITPLKRILIGELGKSEKHISSLHFMYDATLISLGTKKGHIIFFDSKNIAQFDPRMSDKMVDKKQIKALKAVKRMNETDIYFSTQESFFWFENLSEKRRLVQSQAEIIQNSIEESVFVVFKGDNKTIYEYKGGKQIRNIPLEGEKKIMKQFRRDYLIICLFERQNEKTSTPDKYKVHIIDMKNQYLAYFDVYNKVQVILTNRNNIVIVGGLQQGQRFVYILTEKDNSFKIQTFFKKSFFNEAWRFAKNQNCQESLLAEISRLHGDLLYSKNDFAAAIKHYILTLGYVEPSYVIRKFLDVSQIDYLIEYLQKIHDKKLAKKEHTALLLNCYVKKQKIDDLSRFLSQSSIESDLFDIETAIKVCKDLKHHQQAMKLAEQKNKHELYLKILIQDKGQYDKALEHIKSKVDMEEKQKYIIEFGQDFMTYCPQKTIQLIKLMVRVHSISQTIRGRQRDFMLSNEERYVLEQLNFNYNDDGLENLSVITFKKPDEYFRLFLVNNQDLEDFLNYLITEVPKLPHEQVVFHRLIQFYLQMMKSDPGNKKEYQTKILSNLTQENKKYDSNHLLALFKMYDFDEGVVTLCKKLGMRDDLLNFYISKNRDADIIELCKIHGEEEVDLWIHALKYFVKPEYEKQSHIPDILKHLSKISNLSPLPILSILSKNKRLQYKYVKQFFLFKLQADKKQIESDKESVKKNMRMAATSREEFKKLKTQAKPFLSNNCVQCQNGLTFPSIHFMCGHSLHENCLANERECPRCAHDMKNIIQIKQKYAEGVKDQTKFFEALEEKKSTGFEVVAEFLGKGLFKNKI